MKKKFKRADLETLRKLVDLIRECKGVAEAGGDAEPSFGKLRRRLHQAEFYGFLDGVLVKKSKVLEEGGLPMLFGSVGSIFPWDIRADSFALHQRWLTGQLDPHLLVGIETKKRTKASGNPAQVSRNLQRAYLGIRSANFSGDNGLQNGQWW